MPLPLVAIVGRPNVGKSTLFNRLTESRDAIVFGEPGITRDRVYGDATWNGVDFAVVDTGGFVPRATDQIERAVREQVQIAIDEADAIVFVVDVTTGVTDLDDEVADLLRRVGKPVLVMANKADNDDLRWEASTFYPFGLGDVFPVSAVSGTGTGELLDALVGKLDKQDGAAEQDEGPRIAIIGRPNVGKSSIVNRLLGVERSIVTDISGTTRDAVDSRLRYHGRDVVLVDTAGLRKRSRIRENVEFYSVLRTQRAVRSCDVVVLVMDATQGLEAQDIRVLTEAEELNKGLVIAVNKWDLFTKETNTPRDYAAAIRDRLKTLDYIPVLFVSALSGQRLPRVIETALRVDEERSLRIQTSELNEELQAAVSATHPPTYRNRHVRIKYGAQVNARPPVFAIFCNYPEGVKESYRRYLERRFRAAFGFEGVPLTLVFKKK